MYRTGVNPAASISETTQFQLTAGSFYVIAVLTWIAC